MNISHEIRTPMTLIITPLLSLMKQDDDPHRRSVYETIRRNAERILSLINQLMDLRKIDKGMMQMHMSKTDLVPFVQDIYTLFEHQAQMKRVSFRYQHDTDQLPVWIDRRQFDKVVVNILSNAFKFTPPGGDILIRVSHDDQHATIAVSDNGEAIPEDKIQHIFKRFYQTTTHANDRNTGTGIGLDLTRSLVELHHGTILARNLNAEEASTLLTGDSKQGVEFVVTIPLGKAHLSEDEIDVEAPADNSLAQAELNGVEEEEMDKLLDNDSAEWNAEKNRRQIIVIVEDDDEIRDYLTQELSGDYDIRSCTNGREALAETLKCLPDLVLSDVMMPEMDGNTLAATLKTNPQTNHIPIVLLTAKNRDEDKLEGLGTGVDAYIVKPFNMDILRRTIVNLINSRRMLRLKYGRNDELESKVQKVEMKSPDEKLLERIMKVINENISNSDLSVDTIASTVGISRVHLHRKMKELTGQTPHDFIRNIRLKQAAHLLSTGDMNVTEVMYACGFSNSASFSTIFKRFYGMTPRDYKNS
jgi:DNA-binding response OmpR family regulator/two-component sensor histidine kinase